MHKLHYQRHRTWWHRLTSTRHKPHDWPAFFRPRRVLGHLIGAVGVKLVVVAALLFFPITAWLTPDVNQQQADQIVVLTNQLRQQRQVNSLVPDRILADAAYDKAQDMLVNQYFAHVSPQNKGLADWLAAKHYDFSVAGENLAMGFASADEVVKAWINSPTHYHNLIDPDFAKIGVGVVSGDFEGVPTTLVAQDFADASAGQIKTPATVAAVGARLIKHVANHSAHVAIAQSAGQKTVVIRVQATLPASTTAATMRVQGADITMMPTSSDHRIWSGSLLLTKNPQSAPTTPSNIIATQSDGSLLESDVDQNNLQPVKVSLVDQYIFARQAADSSLLTTAGAGYFAILLALSALALGVIMLNEPRHRRPKVLLSAFGFITILLCLIII